MGTVPRRGRTGRIQLSILANARRGIGHCTARSAFQGGFRSTGQVYNPYSKITASPRHSRIFVLTISFPDIMSAPMLSICVMSFRLLSNFNSIRVPASRPTNTIQLIRIACCPIVIFMAAPQPEISSSKCYRLDHQNSGPMQWKY